MTNLPLGNKQIGKRNYTQMLSKGCLLRRINRGGAPYVSWAVPVDPAEH